MQIRQHYDALGRLKWPEKVLLVDIIVAVALLLTRKSVFGLVDGWNSWLPMPVSNNILPGSMF